jgi:hypothetical protein
MQLIRNEMSHAQNGARGYYQRLVDFGWPTHDAPNRQTRLASRPDGGRGRWVSVEGCAIQSD